MRQQQQQPRQNQKPPQTQKSILDEDQESGEGGRESVDGEMNEASIESEQDEFIQDEQGQATVQAELDAEYVQEGQDEESTGAGLGQGSVLADEELNESEEQNQDESEPDDTVGSDYDNVSAAEVEQYLSGVDFPCGRQELIECAAINEASEEILELLRAFPDEEFRSPVDVARCFGQLKQQQTESNG